MYHAVLLIEVVNILVLAIITMLLFVKFNSRMHLYLILSCMALIVNNVGYQLEIQAQSLDTYLVALKFSYTGRIWIGYTLFIFIAELCRVRVPVAVRIVAALIPSGIICIVVEIIIGASIYLLINMIYLKKSKNEVLETYLDKIKGKIQRK